MQIKIRNLTAAPLYNGDVYATIPASGYITVDRTLSDLEVMWHTKKQVAAAQASVELIWASEDLDIAMPAQELNGETGNIAVDGAPGLKTSAVVFPSAFPTGKVPYVTVTVRATNANGIAAVYDSIMAHTVSETGFTAQFNLTIAGGAGGIVKIAWKATLQS